MTTVGIVVNPIAGKDIRRLVSAASHTSDSVKIGIVRRVAVAAVEAGAQRVLLSGDPHHLARRAVEGLDLPAEVIDEPLTGSRFDTVAAARRMWKEQAAVVVALGGDGTCRDVVLGWPEVPLIAMSTGTNNAFPIAVDATAAGTAAGLLASAAIDRDAVVQRSKRVSAHLVDGDTVHDDLALVDLALIETAFVGSRAVLDPRTVRHVVASMAAPSATGLSAIAGRVHPVGRFDPGGVAVRLGAGGRGLRVPLSPGSFTTVEVTDVTPLSFGEPVVVRGPGVIALDGERDRWISPDATLTVSVEPTGPMLVDVHTTLALAAADRCFDVPARSPGGPPWPPSS